MDNGNLVSYRRLRGKEKSWEKVRSAVEKKKAEMMERHADDDHLFGN